MRLGINRLKSAHSFYHYPLSVVYYSEATIKIETHSKKQLILFVFCAIVMHNSYDEFYST